MIIKTKYNPESYNKNPHYKELLTIFTVTKKTQPH